MSDHSLLEPLKRFAEALRLTLLIHNSRAEGVRVVIYCAHPHQMHTLSAQVRHEDRDMAALDYHQRPDLRDVFWHGVKVEIREEEGR